MIRSVLVRSTDKSDVQSMQRLTSLSHMVYTIGSLRAHHLHKFLVIDLTLPIHVCFSDHLINLLVCQLFTKVCHDMAQLCSADKTVSIFVKNFESLNKLLLRVNIFHFTCHKRQELRKIYRAISIGINLVNHVLKLSFCWILAQRSHDSSQFFCGNGTIAILVKQRKRLLELGDLFFSQLVRHAERKNYTNQCSNTLTLE